ncbi:hypothetical protein [Mesorhizobium abyssinicae]|uniref:hypothetical protein n=1 Tax=Mesorhizobium abyssinicae TaxID=1209958 RepID=UPI0033918E1D
MINAVSQQPSPRGKILWRAAFGMGSVGNWQQLTGVFRGERGLNARLVCVCRARQRLAANVRPLASTIQLFALQSMEVTGAGMHAGPPRLGRRAIRQGLDGPCSGIEEQTMVGVERGSDIHVVDDCHKNNQLAMAR